MTQPRRPSDVLQAARALIENPVKWCRFKLHDDEGRQCARGALEEAIGHVWSCFQPGLYPEADYLNAAGNALGDGDDANAIVTINNHVGHSAVMEAFDIAASMAMSDEAEEP